ncbi:MAG: hypothetical protein ACJ71F_16645 [Nitrososphaeraceae archaeon]
MPKVKVTREKTRMKLKLNQKLQIEILINDPKKLQSLKQLRQMFKLIEIEI